MLNTTLHQLLYRDLCGCINLLYLLCVFDFALGLSTEDYKKVMTVLEQAILATDLANYFEKRDKFKMAADDGEIDWQVTLALI